MRTVLVAWLGTADINASKSGDPNDLGPICQAVRWKTFDRVVILADQGKRADDFLGWLSGHTAAKLDLRHFPLTSPTNHGEIYEAADSVLSTIGDASFTFHLSPGTPAMASVWVLLGKTRYPATLIESSKAHGVKEAHVPFDISIDYIPVLLQKPDEELKRLSQGLPPQNPEFEAILHRSEVMKKLVVKARRVAPRNIPVLLLGESGTGKELFARAIHRSSPRKDGAFIAVNCGAIPEELVDAELFGHEKGAFTGAFAARPGHIMAAHGGTLFLDEIGELPLKSQIRLLRVLQEGEVNYLVPFRVFTHTTQFLRDGIKWADLTDKQREALEHQEDDPEAFHVSSGQIDKAVFNKDTNRAIIRNLMEKGIREATGTHPGKTIVFARNHNHAILLEKLFSEMYPQYGGDFCRVIDNYDPRADKLIDDFKADDKRLTIAISVDMLDTGIDVPEVVNLVFAKPVFSKVKFWQMIGRGTRLRPNLFGPGKDKKDFYIFDHWGNFERFDVQGYEDRDDARSKSLLEMLFEARAELAATALDKMDRPVFEAAIDLILKDIRDLPETSVPIREKYRQVKTAEHRETLLQFGENTKKLLLSEIAPLMQWRDGSGESDAFRFDLLVTRIQVELLKASASLDGLRDEVINQVNALRKNLNQVQAKAAMIKKVNSPDLPFWQHPVYTDLEEMRHQLRGIMKFRQKDSRAKHEPRIYDIPEEQALVVAEEYKPKTLEGMDMIHYRNRVEAVLRRLEVEDPTLRKIKRGQPVTQKDLDDLVKLVLVQDSMVDLKLLHEFFPDTAGHLDFAIRRIIGMDAEAVEATFSGFVGRYSANLNARQIQFLNLIKNHIRKYGAIHLEELYNPPFTAVHADSVDGVFSDERQISFLFDVLDRFKPRRENQQQR